MYHSQSFSIIGSIPRLWRFRQYLFFIGRLPQNPLLLLNQYSDDDMDGEQSKGHSHSEREDSVTTEDVIAAGVLQGDSEIMDMHASEDHVDDKNERVTMLNSNSVGVQGCDRCEPNVIVSGSPQRQLDSRDLASASGTSDVQSISEAGLGWKMVLHEESKQYYYWNIETGETSWEIPQVFAQATEVNSQTALTAVDDQTHSCSDGLGNSDVMERSRTALLDGSYRVTFVTPGEGWDGPAFEIGGGRGEQKNEPVEGGIVSIDAKDEIQRNTDVSDAPLLGDGSIKLESNNDIDEINFPFSLVKRGETLLDKLKSMHELQSQFQCQYSLSRLIVEVEIRLSDIKSLASYGKSLLPFWLHSEKHLKKVEMLLGDNITSPCAKSEHADKNEDICLSLTEGENRLQRIMDCESEMDQVEKIAVSNTENAHVSSPTGAMKDSYDTSTIEAECATSPVCISRQTVTTGAGKDSSHLIGTAVADSTQNHGYTGGDDMDMDVDMEDEYANTSVNVAALCPLISKDSMSSDEPAHSSLPVQCPSLTTKDDLIIPPPPDEEWIPPPPPDNELEPPPPPPDDPPEASHQPPLSFPETGQTLVYGEQCNLSYPGANFEYYPHTSSDVSSNNLYGHVQGSQITITQPQFYYSAVPGSYPESMLGNHVEPQPCYSLQNNALTAVSVDGVDSSGESAIVQKSVPASSSAVTSSSFVPNVMADIPGVDGGVNKELIDVPSVSTASQNHANIAAEVNISGASSTTVPEAIATAASLVTKPQSKALRGKKRTVAVSSSLRSNKKVSSLVDKWKAAKEELLEDEEEPETAYEFLERKKQKEIEEWRAKQIASGEAKDNANFQPLGGDWREKVKRKRVQQMSEAIEREKKELESMKQPNLIEISRELPSGWQAYWDESSKQVYYGNPTTSETTWTKPTK